MTICMQSRLGGVLEPEPEPESGVLDDDDDEVDEGVSEEEGWTGRSDGMAVAVDMLLRDDRVLLSGVRRRIERGSIRSTSSGLRSPFEGKARAETKRPSFRFALNRDLPSILPFPPFLPPFQAWKRFWSSYCYSVASGSSLVIRCVRERGTDSA
jgi:hypothetical protein